MSTKPGSIEGGLPHHLPVDADGDVPVRVVELRVGQRLQATVVDLGAAGEVTIGVLGGKVAAYSKVPLEIGRSYDFEVAAVRPHVLLALARSEVFPGLDHAVQSGRLGPGTVEVAEWIRSVADFAHAPRTGGEASVDGSVRKDVLHGVTPESLARFQRELGHDQEARVLRLATSEKASARTEVPMLRQTLKALALDFLQRVDATAASEQQVVAARKFVDGLSGIESENARRADAGSPLWLPLPASPEHGVRDARMFLARGETDASSRRSEDGGAFTVVLLLDLSRLGPMRVDVGLRGKTLDVEFEIVEPSTATALRAEGDALRESLERSGLEVRRFLVRQAVDRQLSIADLLAPPERGAGSHTLDVHA